VPETSVNENDRAVFWQDNVGFARQSSIVDAESEA